MISFRCGNGAISFLLLLVIFLPLVGLAQDDAEEPGAVAVEKAAIQVDLKRDAFQRGLVASVRIDFQYRNKTRVGEKRVVSFPVSVPSYFQVRDLKKSSFRVQVDGKTVAHNIDLLIDSESVIFDRPNKKQTAEWTKRVSQWIEQDKNLLSLVTRFKRLRNVGPELTAVTGKFWERARKHLIHTNELQFSLESVANGSTYFRDVVKLMPEVDPTFRIDQAYQRRKYVSALNDNTPETYRPYEDKWRAQIEVWLKSKPELAELLPKLRESWAQIRESKQLLDGPIPKHLHDVNGLSLATVRQFKFFLERADFGPSRELVRALIPDIRAELDSQAAANKKRLTQWGFDGLVLSPFTGKLMNRAQDQFRGVRDSWRDASVLKELGRPIPKVTSTRRSGNQQFTRPAVIRFETSIDPNASSKVSISYELQLGTLVHPRNSGGFSGGAPEMPVLCPSVGDVPITITVVKDFQPLVSPPPKNVKLLENGQRQFTSILTKASPVLHLMSVRFDRTTNAFVDRFSINDPNDPNDLETLIAKNSNPTVKPLLMSAMYNLLLKKRDGWLAHQMALQVEQEHPNFIPSLKKLRSHWYQAREARELFGWIEAKGKSPSLMTKSDLQRFRSNASNLLPLNTESLQELARRLTRLDPKKLNVQEQMGRRFILCQANVDPKKNLAALLELGKSNPAEVVSCLRLIQFLTIEKPEALGFVLNQIDLNIRAKLRSKQITTLDHQYFKYTQAYYAMCSFRSPKNADRLIKFIHSTDESLLIQGAMSALSNMTLPDRFDELKQIANAVAGASESGFVQYLDLLLRSDRDKAIPFVEGLAKRYPRLAPRVTTALGRSGHQMQLDVAIALYETSKDITGMLQSAIGVLRDQALPKDIGRLEYRANLPRWMNEQLVSVIRTKGGDKSQFAFVEKFYQEFLNGKKDQNYLTCVAAFEQIGDPRAIPYLREIVKTSERKTEAGLAIGSLLLPKRIIRKPVDTSTDEYILGVMSSRETEQKKALAWNELLKDREKSFSRMLTYGPLRDVMDGSSDNWSAEDRQRMAFLTRFGDVAAKQLLQRSENCSLMQRYRIARLLELLLPSAKSLIEVAAADVSGNEDTQQTAKLALELHRQRAN
jgi:hypothetical protein